MSSRSTGRRLPIPSRRRLPALALVALAVALLASSGWFVYADFRPTYRLSADRVDAVPADATVRDAADLSPAARAAFDRARDGDYVVHREPAFLDAFPLYDHVYVRPTAPSTTCSRAPTA